MSAIECLFGNIVMEISVGLVHETQKVDVLHGKGSICTSIPPAVLLINPTFWVSCRVISAIIELRGSAKAYKHKNNLDIIWTANIDCIEADEQEGLLLVVFWTHAVRWTQTVSQPHTHTMHVAHAAPGIAHTLDSVWWKKRGTCVCLWVWS